MTTSNTKSKKRVVRVTFWDEKYSDGDIAGYLNELLSRLEKDVSKRFKEITKLEISEVDFEQPVTLKDLKLDDEEFMLKASFFLINQGKKSVSVLDKLKMYLGALNSSDIAGNKSKTHFIISAMKKNAAKKRWEADPKTERKLFVKECWKEWQEKPARYKSKASFALDMLKKCEELESQKVIENWCRDWEKEYLSC